MRRKRSHLTCLAEDADRATAARPRPKIPQPPQAPEDEHMPPDIDEPPNARKPPKRDKVDPPYVPPEEEPEPHVDPLDRR